jgi:hypothetical protein
MPLRQAAEIFSRSRNVGPETTPELTEEAVRSLASPLLNRISGSPPCAVAGAQGTAASWNGWIGTDLSNHRVPDTDMYIPQYFIRSIVSFSRQPCPFVPVCMSIYLDVLNIERLCLLYIERIIIYIYIYIFIHGIWSCVSSDP